MSRGPGALQRRILEVLSEEPTGYLPWRWLKDRFPLQVRDKSFYRAVRSLRLMGRIDDFTVDRGHGPGLSGRARFAYEEDRELVALAEAAQRQLKTLASARGIRLEVSKIQRSEGTGVDTYRPGRKVTD